MSEKLKARDIIITVVVVILFAVGLVLVLNIYKSEGEKRSASVSDLGETCLASAPGGKDHFRVAACDL